MASDQVGHAEAGELDGVAREGDGDGGHAAALDDEEQRPAVEKRDGRMPGVAQVGVLSADVGPQRRELGVDEGAHERDDAARGPDAEDEGVGGDDARRRTG